MDQILELFRKLTGFDCEITQTLHVSQGFRAFQLRSGESLYVLELKKKPSVGSEESAELFIKEGALLARIYHPFVTRTLAVGETESEVYRIREDREGISLAEKLKASPWDEVAFVRFLISLAEILSEIHQYGLNLSQLNPNRILFLQINSFIF